MSIQSVKHQKNLALQSRGSRVPSDKKPSAVPGYQPVHTKYQETLKQRAIQAYKIPSTPEVNIIDVDVAILYNMDGKVARGVIAVSAFPYCTT
jgi:hypothetical protein